MIPYLLFPVIGTIFWTLDVAYGGRPIGSVLAAIGCWLVTVLFLHWLVRLLQASRAVRLVPFFSDRIDVDYGFFESGFRLVECFRRLEDAASAGGVVPLSSFAAGPSWYGGPPVWHDPTTGLETVRTLHACAVGWAVEGSAPVELVADLENLKTALARAAAMGVGFCLHLRGRDDSVSPMEFDLLPGSYR